MDIALGIQRALIQLNFLLLAFYFPGNARYFINIVTSPSDKSFYL